MTAIILSVSRGNKEKLELVASPWTKLEMICAYIIYININISLGDSVFDSLKNCDIIVVIYQAMLAATTETRKQKLHKWKDN